jgi:hypothetical protein
MVGKGSAVTTAIGFWRREFTADWATWATWEKNASFPPKGEGVLKRDTASPTTIRS